MSILVTGASGFIGRQVVLELAEQGLPVHTMSYMKFDLVTLQSLPDSVSTIIHLAAAGVSASSRSWKDCLKVNILGGMNLDRLADGRKLIVTRSFMEDALDESPDLWNDPYFASKRISSKLFRNATFCRIFHCYGHGVSGVIKYVRDGLLAGSNIHLGSCQGKRDWIHVRDVAQGIIATIDLPTESYDIGTGELTSLKGVVEKMASLVDACSTIVYDPSKDRPDTEIPIKALPFPEWSPKISLEDGLQELLVP